MKKHIVFLALSVLLLSSCETLTKTARVADSSLSIQSATVADLKVSEHRVTHTMTPSKEVLRGGLDNVKQAVEQEALINNGNADILVDPQYVISKRKGLLGAKITSITVSGRPAYYTNFRSLDDSVWCNPVFKGVGRSSRSFSMGGGRVASSSSNNAYRKKGTAKYLSVSGMGGEYEFPDYGATFDGAMYSALLSYGYQLTPYVYLGAGAGLMYLTTDEEEVENDAVIPLFGHARINFSKKANTFFLDYKLGYSVATFGDTIEEGGAFTSMSLGYSFGNYDVAFKIASQDMELDDGWSPVFCESGFCGISLGLRF
jgi:hypothetical protein